MKRMPAYLTMAWLASMMLLSLVTALPARANPIDMFRYGMIWTQTSNGIITEDFAVVNNIYLYGGLDANGKKLPSGFYYVTITTDLAGLNKIATSYPVKPVFVTAAGVFQQPYKLFDPGGIFPAIPLQLDTYYYVWIGKNPFTKPPCYSELERCRFKLCLSVVRALKFWDKNQNGVWDKGAPDFEPPLAGWTIKVNNAAKQLVAEGVTDENGQVAFCLDPANYTVFEVLQPGWVATTPTSVPIVLPPNVEVNVTFGNRESPPKP